MLIKATAAAGDVAVLVGKSFTAVSVNWQQINGMVDHYRH
jgi:hypothetical protein